MKITALIAVFCIGVVLDGAQTANAKLQERFSWTQLAFNWPSREAELSAIQEGRYIRENNLPLGLERWNNKLFVTVPRWKAGVAATLNYIDLNSKEKSPKLRPYPSWEANELPIDGEIKDNATIISTFRIQVDACDRLWVLDTGLSDIQGDSKQITPNAIVIFDLNTNKVIRRFQIPQQQVKDDSFFPNIIVDSERSACADAYAYLPDFQAYGVIVYSLRNDHSYRVEHNFFHFDPLQGDFNVGGINFQWTDGVFGMAVGPIKPDRTKDVYFHAMASTKEFKVSNRVLQNETYVTSPAAYYDFQLVGDRGMNGQSAVEVYDKETGAIFYTQVNKDAIACWNVKRPYTSKNQGLVDKDSRTLVFPNDMKIDAEGTVWVLSDKMPTYLYGELDPTAVNYRILMGKNRDLIKGTPCGDAKPSSALGSAVSQRRGCRGPSASRLPPKSSTLKKKNSFLKHNKPPSKILQRPFRLTSRNDVQLVAKKKQRAVSKNNQKKRSI